MVDKYVKLYSELSKVPIPLGAFCRRLKRSDGKCLEIIGMWEQGDLLRMERVPFQRSVVIDATTLQPISFNVPNELNNEQRRAYSSDGCLTAVLRKLTDKQGGVKQYIEIWKGNAKIKSIDVLVQEKHLHIYADSHFGSFHWSPTNSHLLYTAEKYFKAESFFKADSTKEVKEQTSEEPNKAKIDKGDEFLYRQSWGEQLTNVQFPLVFTLDIESEKIEEVPALPENVSCAQAVWTPDGSGVVFVGLIHSPYKLGSIFCANRQSSVYFVDLATKICSTVSDTDCSVSHPRFSPDGKRLVYLQTPVGGAHRTVQALVLCDWSSKALKRVVDYVDWPGDDNFPGIYTLALPKRIWSADSKTVFINSYWRSSQELISVNVESGEVRRLTGAVEKRFGQWNLLDVVDDMLIASASSFGIRPRLLITRLKVDGEDRYSCDLENWIDLEEESAKLLQITCQTLNLKPTPEMINDKFPNVDYDAILVHPFDVASDGKPYPLIVFPHGGPHSVFDAGYALSVEFFTRLGFAMLLVNYRGSIGFGGDSVKSLIGNVGSQDVADCQHAVDVAVSTGKVDPSRMMLSGGSHGGFLVLSMNGRYPDKYRACIARNPVVNIADMVVLSDIPDWSFAVSGFDFQFSTMSNPQEAKAMREKSPIHLVDKMKTPTLFMLGSQDRRVPLRQGLYLHHALKARNVKTKVFVYDDVHGLAKIQSQSDGLVHMADWLISNCQ